MEKPDSSLEKKRYECGRCTKETWKDDHAAKHSVDRYGYVVCHGCAIKLGNLAKYGVENCSNIPGVQEKKDETKERRYGDKKYNNREKAMKTEIERFGCHHFQDETTKERMRETLFKNYGVRYTLQSEEIRQRVRATSMERYGVPCPQSSEKVIEKRKRTNLERYGVENCSNIPGIQEKKEDTKEKHFGDRHFNNREKAAETEKIVYGGHHMKNKDVQERFKQTLLKNYGVDSPLRSEEIRKKWFATNEKRYGSKTPVESQEIKDKIVKTNLERYGVEYGLSSPEVIEKRKKTNLEKYGHENVGFLAKPYSYLYDREVFDSSWEVAFYIWHVDHGVDVVHNTTEYVLRDDGRRVYPDFKVNGKFVEVKGDHLTRYEGWEVKKKCYDDNGIDVLFWEGCKGYVEYVEKTYGSGYLKSFRRT